MASYAWGRLEHREHVAVKPRITWRHLRRLAAKREKEEIQETNKKPKEKKVGKWDLIPAILILGEGATR